MTSAVRISVTFMIVSAVALLSTAPIGAQDLSGQAPALTAAVTANSARYMDPTGDATAGGMDITNVTVSLGRRNPQAHLHTARAVAR